MRYTHGVICADGSLSGDPFDDWFSSDPGIQYLTDDVAIATEPRECRSSSQPVAAEGEAVGFWLLGDVYGYDASAVGRSGGYESRPSDVDPAQYCASLYEREGRRFVCGLNGNFTLLIYDRERQQFTLCTDRFGTVPVYWTRTHDGQVVFSTNIQFLPSHPAVETSFDPAYLHEYLAFRRTFGVRTPLEGVEKLEPGTLTTVSLADGTLTTDQYWRPRYRPRDESFEWFVDEFARRFRTVLDEWTDDGREHGVLLSGGSDSRLVLAGLDDATCFHMNDWMNREARTAERVAFEADAEFELLERGAQYRIDALERNRWAGSFNGWFSQPYTSGFEDEITGQVDALVSGLYADSLFDGFSVPSPTVSLGSLGSVTVPIERSIETIDDYVDLLLESAHDEFDVGTDLRSVLEANIYRDGEGIVHHGVTYDSLDELVYYGDCYPLSNDDDMRFHTDLRRMLPYRSPFLDNRLIELSLSLPIRYRLRRNLVGQAVDRLSPDLAAIPHASTGVSLSQPFPVEYAGKHLLEFWQKHVTNRTPPKPYLTDGPWLDDAELLRSHEFPATVLRQRADLADGLPGLDADAVHELYREHQHGENRVGELYTLLTVLTMPVTEHVLARDSAVLDDGQPIDTRSLQKRVINVA
ncbi:asparagine synthase [Natronococcus pandeyae]|uniref:Asparagine synthase n=1 Tax=Natronococcus pandeyae TaxID=2055836 RepID=A0A8J8Q0P6_9EURY|nr:asparagine synthase-related protein [Natronococcus pandeyae]TYL36822.1 asparagine synthase [Natronococcus pandeyae]